MRMRILALLLFSGVITACESDTEKLKRLRWDANRAFLTLTHARRMKDSVGGKWVDSLDIAERNFNITKQKYDDFMSGR